MKLLPLVIEQRFDIDLAMHITSVEIGDDVSLYSTRQYQTPEGPDGIYLALTHAIAVTRRVVAQYEENVQPKKKPRKRKQ
jgi:hypothetical protein